MSRDQLEWIESEMERVVAGATEDFRRSLTKYLHKITESMWDAATGSTE